jgi:hypothetical protein
VTAAVDDYLGLITSEHSDKPLFSASVAASVQPMVDVLNLLQSLPTFFDLDAASGAQLDAIGLWVGVSRYFTAPLVGVYFTLGSEGAGFGLGYWKGRFDPSVGLERLDDTHYLILLRSKIAANHWDGTSAQAHDILQTLLSSNYVYVQDNQDMTMTFGITGPTLNAVLKALLTGGYLSLKPAGVGIKGYLTASLADSAMFGFGPEGQSIAGFGHGAWAVSI